MEELPPPVKKRRAHRKCDAYLANQKKATAAAKVKVKAERKVLAMAGYGKDFKKLTVESSRNQLQAAMLELDCDAAKEICKMAVDPLLAPEIRLKANIAILNKLVPDLKSIDMQADLKANVTVVLKSFAGALEVQAAEVAKPVVEVAHGN